MSEPPSFSHNLTSPVAVVSRIAQRRVLLATLRLQMRGGTAAAELPPAGGLQTSGATSGLSGSSISARTPVEPRVPKDETAGSSGAEHVGEEYLQDEYLPGGRLQSEELQNRLVPPAKLSAQLG